MITPVLPFQLSGPVYVVQEVGSVLPKLYVVLEGHGLRVVLHARNSFHRIAREWFYGDPPATELGQHEAEFYTERAGSSVR